MTLIAAANILKQHDSESDWLLTHKVNVFSDHQEEYYQITLFYKHDRMEQAIGPDLTQLVHDAREAHLRLSALIPALSL